MTNGGPRETGKSRAPRPGRGASARELADRERVLRATLDAMPDPYLLLEPVRDAAGVVPDADCLEANAAACRFLRVSRDEVVGQRLVGQVSTESSDALLAWCADALAIGEPVGREERLSTHSGGPRRVNVLCVPVGAAVGVSWHEANERSDDRGVVAGAMATSEAHYRRLADSSIDVVLHTGADGLIAWSSPSIEAILGWRPEEIVGVRVSELMHPDDLVRVQALQQEVLSSGQTEGRIQARFIAGDGSYRWMSDVGRALFDESGALVGGIDALRDVQAEHDAREALAVSEEHYRLLAENSSDIVFRSTRDSRIEWISPSVAEVLGFDAGGLVGTTTSDLVHPDDRPHVLSVIRASGGPGFVVRGPLPDAAGGSRWIAVTVRPVFNRSAPPWPGSAARDIEDQHETREAVEARRFRTAMESAPSGMAVVGLDQRFMEVNPALCRLLTRSEQWLLRHTVNDVMDSADAQVARPVRTAVMSGVIRSGAVEHQMIRADGTRIWVEHSMGLLRDDAGLPAAFVCQFNDITEPREARDQLQYIATHDALTELVNRRELVSRVEGLLAMRPRTGINVAMLFIDVDELKPINDAHGHSVGDKVIVAVAQRIRDQVRANDTVARFGGDEFVVVLPSIHTVADAERVAGKIQAALEPPVFVEGLLLDVTLSIGIAMAEPGDDPDEVLQRADYALYRAKRSGRDRTVVYDVAIDAV
jgi:diguanylate cyclase (GGDEF)-like protein/PAS domain S-box-containing protein